jgi:hypothetical protein
LRLSPKQWPCGRPLWFIRFRFILITGLYAFHLFFFGFSAQRWAHSQSRPPTATATAVTVANAGGELTV